MIASVSGIVRHKTEKYAIVETVAGVGYKVFCTGATLEKIQREKEVFFFTYLAVGEDKLDLYGFFEKDAQELFEQLISVSGVGPRSALSVLDIADTKTIIAAIAAGRADIISKATGIGGKTAQKLILELKTKVLAVGGVLLKPEVDDEVVDALTGLGYQKNQAEAVVADLATTLSTDEKIKNALKILGRQKQR